MFLFLLVLSASIMRTSTLGLVDVSSMNCSVEGLECSVQAGNCSDEGWVSPRVSVPGPPVVSLSVAVKRDDTGQFTPVLSVSWSQYPDGRIFILKGTEVHVTEADTNLSVCVRYLLLNNVTRLKSPTGEWWSFLLEHISVKPNAKYQVLVANLPKPDTGSNAAAVDITVPGSVWDANLDWTVETSIDNKLEIAIVFQPGEFAEQYRVSVFGPDLYSEPSRQVAKNNETFLTVTFTLEVWQKTHCQLDLLIQPIPVESMNDWLDYRKRVDICPYLPDSAVVLNISMMLLSLAIMAALGGLTAFLLNQHYHNAERTSSDSKVKEEVKSSVVVSNQRIFIIYSLDHHLYKQIVLKLCAFLRAKCGAEVALDLLDMEWLSTIGKIQWLDSQRERISKSSDKVLILCSPGVNAKWKALCRGQTLRLREDERSPIGDMLTPALSLILPDFVHASSFYNYIVAYFDDVCCEENIPAPFNIVVQYKLMKHFEELYFRILGVEKYEPGRIKCIEGIRENDYFSCPSGRALQEAIEAFRSYQLKNPDWFEMELLNADDEKTTSSESIISIDGNCSTTHSESLQKPDTSAFVNVVNYQTREHVLFTSIEETTKMHQNSSLFATKICSSDPVVDCEITEITSCPAVRTEQHVVCSPTL